MKYAERKGARRHGRRLRFLFFSSSPRRFAGMLEKILLVLNDRASVHAMAATFALEGYRVEAARDFESALTLLQGHHFDESPYQLIVADIEADFAAFSDLAHWVEANGGEPSILALFGVMARERELHSVEAMPYCHLLAKQSRRSELLNAVKSAMNHEKNGDLITTPMTLRQDS